MTHRKSKNKPGKALVTGGAGFIGSHLVDNLVMDGWSVAVVDDLSTGKLENVNLRSHFYKMDASTSELRIVFEKERPDVVFHLAFNTNVPLSVQDPLFDSRSITCSLNVFLESKRFRVKKVIMASSAFVYGNSNTLPVTESHPVLPISPYAISKIASENYLRFFHEAYGLPAIILRYATVYGPRQIGGALADYIRKIVADERAEMYGDGSLTRDYVYVDDIVRANFLALDVPDSYPNPVFNLGSAKEVTLNDVYEKVARLLNKPDNKPIYLPGRPGELLHFSVSGVVAEKELRWKPAVDIDAGLKLTLKSRRLIP